MDYDEMCATLALVGLVLCRRKDSADVQRFKPPSEVTRPSVYWYPSPDCRLGTSIPCKYAFRVFADTNYDHMATLETDSLTEVIQHILENTHD